MTMTRRQALELVGVTLAVTGAAGCSAPAPAAQGIESSLLRIFFTGLQLFAVKSDHSKMTVAMPKAAVGITAHSSRLLVIGGTVSSDPSGIFQSSIPVLGIRAHSGSIDGYRLRISGDNPRRAPIVIHDAPRPSTTPQTPDEWRSLRFLRDISSWHPGATLKPGWDSSLCLATMEIDEGEMMSLPGDGPLDRYFSLATELTIPTATKQVVTLEGLNGQAPRTAEIQIDSTGPFFSLLGFGPTPGAGGAHHASIENLFDNLSAAGIPAEPSTPRPAPVAAGLAPMAQIGTALPLINWQLVLDFIMQNDGSENCPPFGFWYK